MQSAGRPQHPDSIPNDMNYSRHPPTSARSPTPNPPCPPNVTNSPEDTDVFLYTPVLDHLSQMPLSQMPLPQNPWQLSFPVSWSRDMAQLNRLASQPTCGVAGDVDGLAFGNFTLPNDACLQDPNLSLAQPGDGINVQPFPIRYDSAAVSLGDGTDIRVEVPASIIPTMLCAPTPRDCMVDSNRALTISVPAPTAGHSLQPQWLSESMQAKHNTNLTPVSVVKGSHEAIV